MLFPGFAAKPCGYVNLNDLAHRVHTRRNSFINPVRAQQLIDAFHQRVGWDWSYGGYLERRIKLWEGVPYLENADTFLHLGVDFNVPAGTAVTASESCVVVRVDDDTPDQFGWGNRVIVRLEHYPVYLIYAHLSPRISCRPGQSLIDRTIFAEVGDPSVNGGWFPHLHVQALTSDTWRYYEHRLNELDGYGALEEIESLAKQFPDPLPYLRIWN